MYNNRNTHHIRFKHIKVTDATGVYEAEGDEDDTPPCHVICCGGPRPSKVHHETHIKKEHSGHPRTLGVRFLGPIAYPLGASRYHVPTEKKAGDDADKADKVAVLEDAPRAEAAFTKQAEDEQAEGEHSSVTINPMVVPIEEKKDDSDGFRSGDRVTVTGTSKDDLNGQSGTVKDYDAVKERFHVTLDNGNVISLRTSKLKKFVHDHNHDIL